MLSFPPSQRAHSPVVRSKGWGVLVGGSPGGIQSDIQACCLHSRRTNVTSPRRRNNVRGSMQVAESHLNAKNKNTCGEESRDMEVDDSARGPFKARRECGSGGTGGFCLETMLSNLLQDADISRKTAVGVSWGRGCHSPQCEIKTAWTEAAGC